MVVQALKLIVMGLRGGWGVERFAVTDNCIPQSTDEDGIWRTSEVVLLDAIAVASGLSIRGSQGPSTSSSIRSPRWIQ